MKVNVKEYVDWVQFFWKEDKKTQRLGQSFCNHFGIRDSELFHEPSNKVAIEMIGDKYITAEDV
jgi:hypothetical protein